MNKKRRIESYCLRLLCNYDCIYSYKSYGVFLVLITIEQKKRRKLAEKGCSAFFALFFWYLKHNAAKPLFEESFENSFLGF
jgi:hypothetical protein